MGHDANQVVIARVRLQSAHTPETLDEPCGQSGLGGTDRATEVVIEFDRDIGNAPGGDVGGDIHLLATHDAHLDHRMTRFGEEAHVCRRQAGVLELVHESCQRLLIVDPAQKLPNRAEILDRVDQRRPCQRHEERL